MSLFHSPQVPPPAAVENRPHGWVKGVWWDVKETRKRLVPKEGKANSIISRPIVHAVWVSLMVLKAGGKWPAVRAAPMTPAQGADEDGAGAPPHGAPALGEEVSTY